MRTLDRYVIRSFLSSALLLFVAIMAFRIVANLFFNMDEFVENNDAFGDLVRHVTRYYGYQSLMYFSELGGVIIVNSAAFTLARMNHTNELTAMLASGVSLHRVVLPIVVASMCMGGLVIVDRELLIPPNAANLIIDRDDSMHQHTKAFPIYLVPDNQGAIWLSQRYDSKTQTAEKPILTIRDRQRRRLASVGANGTGRPGRLDEQDGWILTAARLSRATQRGAIPWENTPDVNRIHTSAGPTRLLAEAKKLARRHGVQIPPDANIGNVWGVPAVTDAHYGMVVSSKPPDEQTPQLVLDPLPPTSDVERTGRLICPRFAFATDDGQPLGTFVADAATWTRDPKKNSYYWKLENGRYFYPSDLTPEDLLLRQSSRWMSLMSSAKLTELLASDRVPDRQAALLEKHSRFADPINNLVMLLLGLPFILSRERNIKASAGMGVGMVGGYFAFVHLCRLVGLYPLIAAFLPIVLFGAVAAVMLDSVKT